MCIGLVFVVASMSTFVRPEGRENPETGDVTILNLACSELRLDGKCVKPGAAMVEEGAVEGL